MNVGQARSVFARPALNRFCEFGYYTHLPGSQKVYGKWLGSLSIRIGPCFAKVKAK